MTSRRGSNGSRTCWPSSTRRWTAACTPRPPRQFYTGNASVARRHVIAAGGFDTAFRRAEDVELAYRLADRGLRFSFDHDAVVLHYADRSFDAWRRMATDYGRNDVIFARDMGRTWLLDSIAREFGDRNTLIRGLTRTCLPRPALRQGRVVGARRSGPERRAVGRRASGPAGAQRGLQPRLLPRHG